MDPMIKLQSLIKMIHSMGWEIAIPADVDPDDEEEVLAGMIIGTGPYVSWIIGEDVESHAILNPPDRLVN